MVVKSSTAILLNEHGFDMPCTAYYPLPSVPDDRPCYIDFPRKGSNFDQVIPNLYAMAPDYMTVVDWLFREKKILLAVQQFKTYLVATVSVKNIDDGCETGIDHVPGYYYSIAEAYEAGIEYALTNKVTDTP